MYLLISSIILYVILFIVGKKTKYTGFAKFMKKSLVILIILEVTIFNFRFYESLFFKEIKIDNYTIGDSIKVNEDGSLTILEGEDNYIEIPDIWKKINNIYINFEENDKNVALYYTVGLTDRANQLYQYNQEERIYIIDKDNIVLRRVHLSGKTERVKIFLRTDNSYDEFKIKEISFNKRVDFNISLVRPFTILLFLAVFYIFRPKSSIYKISLFDNISKKYIKMAILLELVFMIFIALINPYFRREKFGTEQRYQYQLLTESLLKGHTYLDVPIDSILNEIRNPYDQKWRDYRFQKKYGEEKYKKYYVWDAAFYKGKYYVYFGISPVITYFLPYYALTGHHLKTSTCIIFTMILTVIGIFLLLYNLCKRYFKKVNLGSFLAFSLLFVNACGLLSIMGRPDHYSLPILMGIMFSIYGINFWIRAEEKNLDTKYLTLGSLCMAAVAASRPQLLLTSFLALPIFWKHIKNKELFSKKTWLKSIMIMLPYIIIALLLMYYNYVRFASPFDFGANYNLTTNDMTRRGFVIGRITTGLYYYLLGPLNISTRYPFILRSGVNTSYLGTTIFEDMGAGFLVVNLLTLLGLFIFKFRDKFKDKLPYNIGKLCVIFTFIIIIADTEMAGILPRYICDFGFLMYIATGIVLFKLLDESKNDKLTKLLYIALIIGILYNFILIFSDSSFVDAKIYIYIRNLFEFWR